MALSKHELDNITIVKGGIIMWYNVKLAQNQQQEYTNDPYKITDKPYAMNVAPDVVSRAKSFTANSQPMFFVGQDGIQYVLIHGTPDGFYYTGDNGWLDNGGTPSVNGYVSKEQLGGWLQDQGYANAQVIACYGGQLRQEGTANSLFDNAGEIQFSTVENPEGDSQLVFEQV